MTSLESYFEDIPKPLPDGEVGDGLRISQTLRKGLLELEGCLVTAYNLCDEVLASQTFLSDGRLAEVPEDDDANRWEYDLPAPLIDVPHGIRVQLMQRFGKSVRPRDINLISSGAELVLRIMQRWVQQDGTPYPPPGYTIDLRPISKSNSASQLRAAHYPLDCL